MKEKSEIANKTYSLENTINHFFLLFPFFLL